MVMALASFLPPASTRRIDGCAAVRARREASVAPAGPASCHSALPLYVQLRHWSLPPTMIISYFLEEEECILTATCHMVEGAAEGTTMCLKTFWDDQLRGEEQKSSQAAASRRVMHDYNITQHCRYGFRQS